jgi:nitrous oxidase accessory protein NosD
MRNMGKALSLVLVLIFLTSLVTLQPATLKAQLKTITVPDDYPTITDAIGNATQGDIIFVKKGTYSEHSLVINKTLTIIGENINNTIIKNVDEPALIDWLGNGLLPIGNTIAVQINADNVKISGFTIVKATTGLKSVGFGAKIAGNIIKGLDTIGGFAATTAIIVEGKGSQVVGNNIEAGTGISASGLYQTIAQNYVKAGMYCINANGQYIAIVDNILSGASARAIALSGNNNVIYNNTVTDNFQGIGFNGSLNLIAGNNIARNIGGLSLLSGYVLQKCETNNNIISKNLITSNREGVNINNGQNNTVSSNYIGDNQIGISVLRDQTGAAFEGGKLYFEPDRNLWEIAYNNTFYNNNFVGNGQGAADWSWQGTNFWNNSVNGNYWSDYKGTDANLDGKGDTPYTVNKPYTIYASFGDGDSRLYYPDKVNANEVIDHSPLIAPFNIESLTIELPDWANASTIEQSELNLPKAEPFPTVPVAAGSAALIVAVAVISVLFYRRRRPRAV